jgi:hypothetical protein
MLKILLRTPIAPTRWLAIAGLLLLVGACAAASADPADSAKDHGFYGSVIGGWSQP